MNNIVLIGFMGSGKSTLGRLLAKEMGSEFIDTDAMIEKNEGKSIQGIFEEKGEAYFRQCEEELVQWLGANANGAIISTGGGMLIHCEGLKEIGKIVYLKVPFKTILSRISSSELEKRPLFVNAQEAEKKYLERSAIYEAKSDLTVDADAGVESALARLRDAVV